MSSEHEVIRDLIADQLNELRGIREAIASLATAIAGQAPAAVQADAAKVIQKAAKPAKAVESPKPEAPADTPTANVTATPAPAEPAPAAPVADSHSEVTYDDVAALVIKYSKAHGRPAAVEMLKPFGLTALTQAKPEQYVAIAGAFALELDLV